MLKRVLGGLLAACLFGAPAFATTYTTCQAYSLPVPGDPAVANIWGTILNTNTSLIDTGMGGATSLSVAGSSNVVLTSANGSADQSRSAYYNFTGALTGNIDVLVGQNRCGRAVVHNGTTGAFTLSVGNDNGAGSPAGTVVAIPQGETAMVYFDGTNAVLANTPGGIGALTPADGVPSSRSLTASTGLSGGGDLSADRSFSLASIATGKMLANESGSNAAPTATNLPVLHQQVFTSSGTFTVPANATSETVFKFTAIGGGGGGGGGAVSGPSPTAGGGGASGAAIVAEFSGFTAGSSVTITRGAGGVAGSNLGTDGGTGGNTTVSYSAVNIITASGSTGGKGSATGSLFGAGGIVGNASATASGTSLVLVSSHLAGAQNGNAASTGGSNYTVTGAGGGNSVGTGGASTSTNSSGAAGIAGNNGAGGSGGQAQPSISGFGGGTGGTGIVIVEWVL